MKSSVHEEVQSTLASRLQDQKVVEVEITENVIDRLKQLGTIVGIPLGLLVAFLSLWGIRSMSDVDNKIKEETGKAVIKMNKEMDEEGKKSIEEMRKRVAEESNKIISEERENARASIKSAVDSVTQDVRAMGQRLGTVENTVKGLVAAVSCNTTENLPVTNIEDCHGSYPNGCSRAQVPRYDAFLNSLKNQMPPPDSQPSRYLAPSEFIALEHHAPSAVTNLTHEKYKSDLEALGEGKIFAVIGYLYEAHLGGAETVNCNLIGEHNVDFHLAVGFDAKYSGALRGPTVPVGIDKRTLEKTSIVAEMTPYYRLKFHPRWNISQVSSLIGRQIKLSGQLMMDSTHLNARDDCAITNAQASCWRMSVWEIHPVTEFWVCTSDAPCSQEDSRWTKLENLP